MRGEFELIAHHFAPLAEGAPGAFGLRDDAAVMAPPDGRDLVYTLDTIVAGVHFLPDDPAGDVARKLLRVNLSDLAAMGARPLGYLLSAVLAKQIDDPWLAGFADGLRGDQDRYGLRLLGGDTTSTPGPTTLSLTAIGTVPHGRALRRDGARDGDAVFVSGTIGDAALGLAVLTAALPPASEADRDHLVMRYRRPQPRLAAGQALLEDGIATAAIDVSDGLVADLGHICETSGLAAEIRAPSVPLSGAAQRLVERDHEHLATALTGGDDYELLFTAPPDRADAVAALAERLDLPLTRIGNMAAGRGVTVLDAEGTALALDHMGWTHF